MNYPLLGRKKRFRNITKFVLFTQCSFFPFYNPYYFITSIIIDISLREKCRNTELFMVRIFPHSDWIRRVSGKIRTRKNCVWTLFTQWNKRIFSWLRCNNINSFWHCKAVILVCIIALWNKILFYHIEMH